MYDLEFDPTTANVRELRAFCKDRVPNYGPVVKQGKVALVQYVQQWQQSIAETTAIEAETEGVQAVELAAFAPASLTRTERAIGLVIDAGVAAYDAGVACRGFWDRHELGERLYVLGAVLLTLTLCAGWSWAWAMSHLAAGACRLWDAREVAIDLYYNGIEASYKVARKVLTKAVRAYNARQAQLTEAIATVDTETEIMFYGGLAAVLSFIFLPH